MGRPVGGYQGVRPVISEGIGCKAQLDACILDHGAAGPDTGSGALDGDALSAANRLRDGVRIRSQLFGLILGDDPAFEELRVARGLRFGILRRSSVAGHIRFKLSKRCLILGEG